MLALFLKGKYRIDAKRLLLFGLLHVIGVIHAQERVDSLTRLLQNAKDDTVRVRLLARLSRAYVYSKPDTSLLLAQQGVTLAKQLDFTDGEAECLNAVASVFTATGNYSEGLTLHLEVLRKAESIDDKDLMSHALFDIGVVYGEMGDDRKGIDYTFQAIEIAKQIHNDYYVAVCLINIADSYKILNLLDSAILLTQQGYEIARRINNSNLMGFAFNNLGNIYAQMNRNQDAMSAYRSSIPFILKAGNFHSLSDSYIGIAKLFLADGKNDSCLFYARLSLLNARRGGFAAVLRDVYSFLSKYYISVHNADSAFVYQAAEMAIKDSVFSLEKQREIQTISLNESIRKQQIKEARDHLKNQVKFYFLIAALVSFFFIGLILYRSNKHKQKSYALLLKQKKETDIQRTKAEQAFSELKSTQAQLIQSEKMASLGELTAGIAHEIQNPLNFVNNFSEVNKELLTEMNEEVEKGNLDEAKTIAKDISDNEEKINYHGKRADAIVKSMLQHSRSSSGRKEHTDINALCDEYLRLAYHGLRAKDKSFNAKFETDFDDSIGKMNVVPQDIGRVILNLINNAFYAVSEKAVSSKLHAASTSAELALYEPLVVVQTKRLNEKIEIRVSDNGNGIPAAIKEKIFQPFFTTKPTGQGTGLGLSLAYDIVRAHGGEIKVETNESEGTTFIIELPNK